MHFTHKIKYKNGILANIKCPESVPGIGIAKLKRREQKTVYITFNAVYTILLI